MENEQLYSSVSAWSSLSEITNPIDCLIRFRELTIPLGYVDNEKLKKTICQYIDDSGLIHF